MLTHYCHAIGCNQQVPPQLFMCAQHWAVLPEPLRALVWKTFRPGAERERNPSPVYLAASSQAIAAAADYDVEHGSLDLASAAEARRMAEWCLSSSFT